MKWNGVFNIYILPASTAIVNRTVTYGHRGSVSVCLPSHLLTKDDWMYNGLSRVYITARSVRARNKRVQVYSTDQVKVGDNSHV